MDRLEPAQIERYLHAKRDDGLSAKTVQNHLNFLHGIFGFAIRRGWATGDQLAVRETMAGRAPPSELVAGPQTNSQTGAR
jgi:site-specific recombinase XerD